jgi:hypothetical protein
MFMVLVPSLSKHDVSAKSFRLCIMHATKGQVLEDHTMLELCSKASRKAIISLASASY